MLARMLRVGLAEGILLLIVFLVVIVAPALLVAWVVFRRKKP